MQESLGRYITTISKHIKYYINQRANKFNLNIDQVHILKTLYDNQGVNQEELTEIYKSDKVTISKLLDRLVEEGYIEKRRNKDDRRVKNLYVTEKGEALKGEIKEIFKDITRVLASDFSEKENFIIRKLLSRMSENIYEEVNKER
jgi:DNA-binding MarR family transcriptional regulator